MNEDRKGMERALKNIVVPKIRSLNFTGRFPHFRRKSESEHQMLMIMFNKYGGSFYLEAGRISEESFRQLQQHWKDAGKILAEKDLTVGHCKWNERSRLGHNGPHPNTDYWFKFGQESLEVAAYCGPSFEEIAEQVALVVNSQVEVFFESAP